ncbi:MAG TPA: 16S rRNA (adenine(1518)-N(6)/adenine(1519)-N(6))-dimethyltransferase RsmA [Candidatus Eremiobacteraceae bacterium]|nr:16S rRNA (adenine(1518)-N(6)/adenine(1519)-N(6))-dimethyltransferase RsmA [Candidatus Eremiobacteraceae bacterium]
MTRQKLGQHFLSDPGWREKIARAVGVSPHGRQPGIAGQPFCWIEVGAGHGEMTEHLARSGAPVIAVELDKSLLSGLRRVGERYPNLTVVHADILETDLAALAAGRRIRVYGNLPYYITSPILHHFFQYAQQIDEAHLVVQLEVAARLTAHPGRKQYGYLSVATQFYSRPQFVLRLPPNAFRPPPEVASALVTIRFPGEAGTQPHSDTVKFLDFVKTCFAQKRKTLTNNLRQLASGEQVRAILDQLNLRKDARAEQLSVREFMVLFQLISSEPSVAGPDSRS